MKNLKRKSRTSQRKEENSIEVILPSLPYKIVEGKLIFPKRITMEVKPIE